MEMEILTSCCRFVQLTTVKKVIFVCILVTRYVKLTVFINTKLTIDEGKRYLYLLLRL